MIRRPCETCGVCTHPAGCPAWWAQYLERQKQINAYAKRLIPKPIPDEVLLALRRDLPGSYRAWLRDGACGNCPLREPCDTPCPAYLQWWDEWMDHFRRMLE